MDASGNMQKLSPTFHHKASAEISLFCKLECNKYSREETIFNPKDPFYKFNGVERLRDSCQ